MKILILTFSTLATFFGAWLWKTSQSQGMVPAIRNSLDAVAATGITELPGHVAAMSRDLWEIAQTHNLGVWHGVLIVLAVLLARKAVLWLVR